MQQETSFQIDRKLALQAAIRAARLGREVLLKCSGNLQHIENKDKAGLVSEADRESEKVIFNYLKSQFPDIGFLGEETSYLEGKTGLEIDRPKVQWIVDPLDGTTNYVHGFPIYCISIGLEIHGKIEVACIDLPVLGETYTAISGQGAWVNGRPLRVNDATESLRDSLLATGFFADDESQLEEQLRVFSKLIRITRGVRRPGAAAYDLCMVARGVFDAFWERNLKPWDTAAGLLLVQEAGGVVQTYRGNEYDPFKNSIVAGSKKIVPQVIHEMQGMIRPETD